MGMTGSDLLCQDDGVLHVLQCLRGNPDEKCRASHDVCLTQEIKGTLNLLNLEVLLEELEYPVRPRLEAEGQSMTLPTRHGVDEFRIDLVSAAIRLPRQGKVLFVNP